MQKKQNKPFIPLVFTNRPAIVKTLKNDLRLPDIVIRYSRTYEIPFLNPIESKQVIFTQRTTSE